MTEFTVDITSRTLGVKLSNFGSHIGIHQVESGSIGDKLGLIPGDVLLSINESSVIDMRSDKALNLFRIQQLPFTATFERFTSQSPISEDSLDIDNIDNIDIDAFHYLKTVPESDCSDIELKDNETDSTYEDSKDDHNNNSAYTICINDEDTPISRHISEESVLELMDDISASYDIEDGLYQIGLGSPSLQSQISNSSNFELDLELDINSNSYGLYDEDNNEQNYDHLTLQIDPFASSNYEYTNNETTKIIKPFYQIGNDQQISLDLELPGPSSLMLDINSSKERKHSVPLPEQMDCLMKDEDGFLYAEDCDDLFNYADIDINTKLVTNGFLRSVQNTDENMEDIQNLTARYLYDNAVMFREERVNIDEDGNERVLMISNNGFNYGIHSWSIQINASDVYLQEIGVISTDYDNVKFGSLSDNGLKSASELGARAIYGNELLSGSNYYTSYNDDNNTRCDKDLSKMKMHKIGWCQGDIIKCQLNLRKNTIRFYLNGKKVRKVISLQNNKTWYPVICYSGNCQYELIHYE